MLPVKKSNFLAATLKREETAKQWERERARKTGGGRTKRESKRKERDGVREGGEMEVQEDGDEEARGSARGRSEQR